MQSLDSVTGGQYFHNHGTADLARLEKAVVVAFEVYFDFYTSPSARKGKATKVGCYILVSFLHWVFCCEDFEHLQ